MRDQTRSIGPLPLHPVLRPSTFSTGPNRPLTVCLGMFDMPGFSLAFARVRFLDSLPVELIFYPNDTSLAEVAINLPNLAAAIVTRVREHQATEG